MGFNTPMLLAFFQATVRAQRVVIVTPLKTQGLLRKIIMGLGKAGLGVQSCWLGMSQYRLLFAVGFCGSFTTLSALVMELHTMLHRSELLNSFAYLVATMVGGFACFYIGFMLLRAIR